MSSPFVRRRRLGAELRALRQAKGLTTEQLGAIFHQSRMKISRLENAQVRPDLAEIMDLLDLLEPTKAKRAQILRVAREAAAKGWWDAYGDAMGDRQRLYADLESGAATIREYQPGTVPGLLQTPEYTWALVERSKAEGPLDYLPERMAAARRERQKTAFRPGGPAYEVVLDEIGVRRFAVRPRIMAAQINHMIDVARANPIVTIRVFPIMTAMVPSMMPRSQQILFTFPDPDDPPMAVDAMLSAHHVHTDPEMFARYLHRYETVRAKALSEEDSLRLLADIADQILDKADTST